MEAIRFVSVLVLAACAFLASAASATAAVTRVQVDWTAYNVPGQAYSIWDEAPEILVFEGGGPAGQYIGPCAERSINCTREKDFRWVESNPNGGGEAQTVSFVDDRPQRRRQLCFEVRHPTLPDSQTDPEYTVTVTVTDPAGARRTRTFTFKKGQTSKLDCSPVFRRPKPLGARKRRPAWWVDGTRLLKARGAKCDRETSKVRASHPVTGRKYGTYSEVIFACGRKVPRMVAKRLNIPRERCAGTFSKGNPEGDEYAWFCEIVSAAQPTASAWSCKRFKDFQASLPGEKRSDPVWSAQRTGRSSKYERRTLAACLHRRPGP